MGGDHKCPLCSATFTRPQHVGRHLRAHTGDRPYECKECPLRFARSDLLSRHVNKAHKPPDENGNPPKGKKGRRKSMPTSAQPPIPLPLDDDHAGKARRASFHQSGQLSGQIPANLEYTSPHISQSTGQPQPPPLQAQSMYPHHPLLATTPQNSRDAQVGHWTSNLPLSMDNLAYTSMLNNQFAPGTMGMPALAPNYTQGITSSVANTFQPPFTAVPMRLSGSDQGSAAMGRNNSSGSLNSLGYEFGFKKRACDQCNHSKVRCDFTEPCQRCANRNLRCSYNKPQKSRSIAALPVPRAVQPHLPVNASMSSNIPGVSDSPQSQYSSPHSNPSPVTSTMAAPGVPPLQAPMPLPMQDSNAMLYTQGWQHNQWQSSNNQPLDNPYATTQQSPQSSMYASISSLPSTTSSQHQPLPLPHRHSGSSTLSSPHNRMLQTPSLTSLTTSPDTDGPPERRNSSSSFNNNNFHADIKGQSMDPNAVSDGFSGASISPSHMHGVAGMQDPSMYQSDANAYAWAGPMGATIDPRQQFRNLTSAGEESDRMNHPSTASATGDGLDEAALKALNERRRSSNSTGLWANAFNQMTLQDGIVDPYTASQYAQASTASARRPSYPTHLAMPEGSGVATAKIPSLGDVKDLWKLFMSEPMTSSMMPSSSTDAFDYGNLGAPSSATAASLMTPPVRPGVGARGLSRSNSMPDLTSPLANGNAQPFFSGLAITPKPALPRSSYVQSQYADMPPVTAADATAGNEVLMRSWKDSIKNRQASFEFGANPQAKMKSPMPSNTMPPTDPSIASMGDYMSNNFGRPLASVLQHSSALQQTLAPERTPSFGGDNLHMSGKPSFRANAAKYSSSLARPGNKRLASQTLVPNDGKKTSGDSWDDNMGMMGGEDDTSAGFVIPTGLGGGTGMTPNPMLGHQYFAWTAPPAVPGMGMGHHSGF